MDKHTKSENISPKYPFWIFMVWAGILLLVMTVASIVFIGKGCSGKEYTSRLEADSIDVGVMEVVTFSPEASEKLINDPSSFIQANAYKAHVDSLNTLLFKNQEDIRERQTELIADIRQETNNNLDKMSAWLAFWITVLGFVGIACPVAYQFLNYKNMDKELNDLRARIKSEEERQNMVNSAYRVKMNVVAFSQLCDNRLDDHNRTLRSLYINSIKDLYQKFLNGIEPDKIDWKELKVHICSVLINIDTFLTKYRVGSLLEESKKIRDVLDLLPEIIKNAANASSYEQIKEQLLKIQTKLTLL